MTSCLALTLAIALLGAPARADTQVELSTLAGGRSAPESTILLPSAWEGELEPAALLAVDGKLRLGASSGPWARLGLAAWGYAPESEASMVEAGPTLGWSDALAETVRLDAAVRYDLRWYPVGLQSGSGRGEALLRLRADGRKWSLLPELRLVDRRYLDLPEASFSTGELGTVLAFAGPEPVGFDLGLSGQGNQAGGIGSGGRPGAQLRSLARLRLSASSWQLALEHRLTWSLDGETEREVQPVFTSWSDYSDDADALSGGGFVQHRIGLSGAAQLRSWVLSGSLLARLRQAEADELAASYAHAFQARLRLDRSVSDSLVVFASTGAATASSDASLGYTDFWGWGGLEWHPTLHRETDIVH